MVKRRRNPSGRAKAGGEYGVNMEWYEGGKFLPSRADRAKQAPPSRLRGGRRAEIEPGVWATAPGDWMVPLWGTVREFVDHQHLRSTGNLRIAPHLTFGPTWGYMPKAEIQRRLDALIDGYRWEIVESAPQNAGKFLREDEAQSNPSRLGGRNPPQNIALPDKTPTRLALRPSEKSFALLTEWGRVYRVDGAAVRRQFTPFIGGGHHRWCKAIPEGEVWIERGLGRDGAFLLIHELTEILLMHTLGFSYDKAHRYANMAEAACRVVDEQVAHHKRPGFRERAIASTLCAWMDMIYDMSFDWKAKRANAIASAFVRY